APDKGVLLEPTSEEGRLVLWLPEARDGGFQDWLRISTVARAEVTAGAGLRATAPPGIRARPRLRGLLGRFLPTWRRGAGRGGVAAAERGSRRAARRAGDRPGAGLGGGRVLPPDGGRAPVALAGGDAGPARREGRVPRRRRRQAGGGRGDGPGTVPGPA